MSPFVGHMTAGLPSDPQSDQEILNPSWAEVESAIRQLPTPGGSGVFLFADRNEPETYMAIGGGDRGSYLVFTCKGNEQFDQAITPNANDGVVTLVTGGQPGEFQIRELVRLDEALAAAHAYFKAGQLDPSLDWHRL